MQLTDRDLDVLRTVADHDVMIRSQITRLVFPGDKGGRITRKRVDGLSKLDLLSETFMQTVNPTVNHGIGSPVYYPSAKGAAFLAQELEDDRYLLLNTQAPHHLYLYHFIAVTETHMMLNRAAGLCEGVRVAEWFGERALVDRGAKETVPGRYRLQVQITDKLVCKPDA